MQVSKVGFKTIIKPDIVLNVQDALAINFKLPLGAVSEIVTIEGGAPLVNTESAAVSTVIDRQFVENLPMNGRCFNTLLQLTPGVVVAPANSNSPGQFSIAGQRTSANNFHGRRRFGKLRRAARNYCRRRVWSRAIAGFQQSRWDEQSRFRRRPSRVPHRNIFVCTRIRAATGWPSDIDDARRHE